MGRLEAALTSRYSARGQTFKIHMPSNLETLRLSVDSPMVVQVCITPFGVFVLHSPSSQAIGTIAIKPPQANDLLSGVLLVRDSSSCVLVNPDDLRDIANVSAFNLFQKQKIVIHSGWDLIRWHLDGMYGGAEEYVEDGVKMIRVCDFLRLKYLFN